MNLKEYHDIEVLQLCSRDGNFIKTIGFNLVQSGIIAWIAGEQWKLNAFSKDYNIYNILANRLDLPRGNLVRMIEYYGRYNMPVSYLANKLNNLISESSLQISFARYKDLHPNTQRLWKDLNQMARAAFQNPGETIDYGLARNGKHRYKGISFTYKDPYMIICLPDGSKIAEKITEVHYNQGIPILKGKKKRALTGGKWLQIITEAFCHNLIEKSLLDLELSGYYLERYEPKEIDLCCGRKALVKRIRRYLKEPLDISELIKRHYSWQPKALPAPRLLLPAPKEIRELKEEVSII